LLLFLGYDFIVVCKPSKAHLVVDAFSKPLYITKPTSVLDQTIDASLFNIEHEWLKDVKEFLRTRQIDDTL